MSVRKGICSLNDKYQRIPYLLCKNTLKLRSITRLSNVLILPSSSLQCQCSVDVAACSTAIRNYSAINEENLKERQGTAIDVQPPIFEDIKFDEPISHDELLTALKSYQSLEEQMIVLKSKLSLTEEDIEKRFYFAKKIEDLLRPFFLDIKIQMFGSTVNGFGFRGCDLDMSFETTRKEKVIPFLERPDVPLVGEVLSGKVSPQDLSELPAKEQLLFIHAVLQEFYAESSEPTIFINAYVPLVRFYHDRYNLKCDLSCRNKVAFSNTKLLYLFGKLDDRVIPLMMTVRYWAKYVELIGKGLLFNTYTVSLMVIYFLQTRKPPILPNAQKILSISNSLEIEDMNDKSFLELKNILPASENQQTLAELLKEFFLFYLNFDFTRVICPLIGKAVPREEFFSATRDRKFKMNTICVQDPMLECHNVAELVDFKSCRKFTSKAMLAYKLIENSESSNSGLAALFDQPNYQTDPWERVLSITLPLVKNPLKPGDSKNKLLTSAQTILGILQQALLINCQIRTKEHILDTLKKQDEFFERQRKYLQIISQRKVELPHRVGKRYSKSQTEEISSTDHSITAESVVEQFENFDASHELLLCAECKTSKNVWLGREFIEIDSHHGDLLSTENFISICTAKQNEQNQAVVSEAKVKPFEFLFECYVSPQNTEASLLVNFRPLNKAYFNPVLGIFLKEYLPKLITRMNNS